MQDNFNYDCREVLRDHIAEALIEQAINPNYITINRILGLDNVKDHRDFMDTYGNEPFTRFIKIYKKGVNND